jgi:ethanolamine ammonia-lyase small subunit
VGGTLPTQALLDFELAHARARDAVQARFDAAALARELQENGFGEVVIVASQARDRMEYLLRPDLGRALDEESREKLKESMNPTSGQNRARYGAPDREKLRESRCDLGVVIADGLSAVAPARHAMPVLREVFARMSLANPTSGQNRARYGAPDERGAPGSGGNVTVVVANHGRVALGDEIGEILGAEAVVVLIGERPGLSSPDSLGIYLTWAPRVGRTDAERNCISNVRPEGLAYAEAARRLLYLLSEARRLKLSGVGLKDDSGEREASEKQLAKDV